MKNKLAKKVRVQFDFSENAVRRLDNLVVKTDSTSRAEVVRGSLKLFEYLIEKSKNGWEIKLSNGEGKEENLVILFDFS